MRIRSPNVLFIMKTLPYSKIKEKYNHLSIFYVVVFSRYGGTTVPFFFFASISLFAKVSFCMAIG